MALGMPEGAKHEGEQARLLGPSRALGLGVSLLLCCCNLIESLSLIATPCKNTYKKSWENYTFSGQLRKFCVINCAEKFPEIYSRELRTFHATQYGRVFAILWTWYKSISGRRPEMEKNRPKKIGLTRGKLASKMGNMAPIPRFLSHFRASFPIFWGYEWPRPRFLPTF